MLIVKPDYFEVSLANWKNNQFQDVILIYTINESFQLIEESPLELFFHSRNRAIIHGRTDNCVKDVSREIMSIGTKKQQYVKWDPVLTIDDLKRMIKKRLMEN